MEKHGYRQMKLQGLKLKIGKEGILVVQINIFQNLAILKSVHKVNLRKG
jgi:hypothetical protein